MTKDCKEENYYKEAVPKKRQSNGLYPQHDTDMLDNIYFPLLDAMYARSVHQCSCVRSDCGNQNRSRIIYHGWAIIFMQLRSDRSDVPYCT